MSLLSLLLEVCTHCLVLMVAYKNSWLSPLEPLCLPSWAVSTESLMATKLTVSSPPPWFLITTHLTVRSPPPWSLVTTQLTVRSPPPWSWLKWSTCCSQLSVSRAQVEPVLPQIWDMLTDYWKGWLNSVFCWFISFPVLVEKSIWCSPNVRAQELHVRTSSL